MLLVFFLHIICAFYPCSHINTAFTMMEESGRERVRSWAKRWRISKGVVWSEWYCRGAAFSPHAYFEHVQNKRSQVVAW